MFRDLFGTPKTHSPALAQSRPPSVIGPSQTVLGARTHFVGNLTSEGNVHVEDTFKGDIRARGSISLGKGASIDGNLVCDRAIVGGLVKGNVTARTILVLSSGRVLGDLRMEKLMTEDGAFIQGVITLEESLSVEKAPEERPVATAPQPPRAPYRVEASPWRRR